MDNNKLLGYLEAKIEELHSDIREIKTEVSELKADFIRRQAVYRLALYVLGGVSAIVGWIMNHIISR